MVPATSLQGSVVTEASTSAVAISGTIIPPCFHHCFIVVITLKKNHYRHQCSCSKFIKKDWCLAPVAFISFIRRLYIPCTSYLPQDLVFAILQD